MTSLAVNGWPSCHLTPRRSAILDETGAFIHAMAYRAGSYDERTPLMHGIMEFAPTVLTSKPEAALYLEKARDLLGRAGTMMGAGLTDDAGRTAYLAGLHAASRPRPCG